MTYPSAKTSLCHPDSFPSKSPVTSATQFYCHLLERHGGGHVQTTQILYLDSSKTASKNCVPQSVFNAGFNNFLAGNRFGFLKLGLQWKDWVLWLESLPCSSVDAMFFILVSRRYHAVQGNTCSPHFQLSFPSWRQEVEIESLLYCQ